MTEVQDSQLNLDFSVVADNLLPGFRMQRLEVYNWGTFDGRIWRLDLQGRNGLLTGDIGSGKSSLVDAITTLLVRSPQYNKAAGAEAKERTIKSYVLGYYKSERNEIGGTSKPVALRDNTQFSVLLGVFHNAGYVQTVSLAQVFWIKEPGQPPARWYITAEREMSIESDFSDFRGDIGALRRKLGSTAELHDSYKSYGAWFRRRFGIENEQAMDLFHQTVSMKSVSNLTDFVRSHMLEESDVQTRIRDLITHFDDLTSAHDAVLKAKKQVELLTPIVADCHRHAELTANKDRLRACRDALKTYFASVKLELLNQQLDALAIDWAKQDAITKQFEQKVQDLRKEESDLTVEITANGGGRIEQLERDIHAAEIECARRKQDAKHYADLVSVVGQKPAKDAVSFVSQRADFARQLEVIRERQAEVDNARVELGVSLKGRHEALADVNAEIADLKSRRTNIPREQIDIRTRLTDAVGVPPDVMPFAGELLQVHEEERDWEGAAERLLRGFGLSILVPDKHYREVLRWVDENNLRGRVVYFRVRDRQNVSLPELNAKSLARKIAIKRDTLFYDWLERELAHRADLACCDTQEEFQRESRAITRNGQIKKPGDQHEKDDRHRIDDRRRFVLGWANESKIAALQSHASTIEGEIRSIESKLKLLADNLSELKKFENAYIQLEVCKSFELIDWESVSAEIVRMQEEKRRLETTSDLLAQLRERRDAVRKQIEESESKCIDARDKRSKIEQKQESAQAAHALATEVLSDESNESDKDRFAELDELRAATLPEYTPTADNCASLESKLRESLGRSIDNEEKKLNTASTRISVAMANYKKDFPVETSEVDANVESADDFVRMLTVLQADDLPRHEARFKDLLNENAVNEIANFQSQLNRQRQTIVERVERINESLTKIDYHSSGRYIRLVAEANNDKDIADFQTALRTCTENTLTGSDDENYSERKFIQIKDIIERFRGREGQTDIDKRWTARVTDVRNWFTFAASERWREGDKEFEHYSDSSGKSGGQKEKLAYTILAASLAYQFGLEWGAARTRNFRFVMIDEAFGKGSEESAEYGLNLFAQLNLQLLVVTPLQKIRVIEPYVSSVGFCQNADGSSSKILNMTIEQYHEQKASLVER
jgi:uncharacterized protein YPO0396